MIQKFNIEDYCTHIENEEDVQYLRSKLIPVNIRLMKSSSMYRDIILQQCDYIKFLSLTKMHGYKKPHGFSSANAGLSFNIIGVVVNRNKSNEYCKIMINPKIILKSKNKIEVESNCGSVILGAPIKIKRHSRILVSWIDEELNYHCDKFVRSTGGFTIQHEIDHNNGILITDYDRH